MPFEFSRTSFRIPALGAGLGILMATWLLPLAVFGKPRNSPPVARWAMFEIELSSRASSSNAWREAQLDADFTGPDGAVTRVAGFWDGQKRWRIRFAPDQLGGWRYQTTCSDVSNTGLHGITGRFICTAPSYGNRFDAHGPVQVARGGRHFEHADRTPFLWLTDVACSDSPRIPVREMRRYAELRASQGFTAVSLKFNPDPDAEGPFRFDETLPGRINLDFCRRVDAELAALNQAGLLAVVAPLWEIGLPAGQLLPEAEAAALLRYWVGRWGAHHVAWLIAVQGQDVGARVSRWLRLGREVFGNAKRGPALFFPGDSPWLLDEFRREPWLNGLAFQTRHAVNDDGLQWLLLGPLAKDWRKSPPRPLLNLDPPPATTAGLGPDEARQLLWWSTLFSPVAGTSWNTEASFTAEVRAMTILADILQSVEFWRLRPAPEALANQPGRKSPRQHIAAAASDEKDLLLVYLPASPSVELLTSALPRSPRAKWCNPRTGESAAAHLTATGPVVCAMTPGEGDWVLVIQPSEIFSILPNR